MGTRAHAGIVGRIKAGLVVGCAVVVMGTVVGIAQAAPAVPSGSQLTDQLNLIVNRAADHTARVGAVADPSALTGADNIAALKDVFGWMFTWKVVNPTVSGDNLNAQLAITLNDHSSRQGQVETFPLVWNDVDNQWKLSKGSICTLAKHFQSGC